MGQSHKESTSHPKKALILAVEKVIFHSEDKMPLSCPARRATTRPVRQWEFDVSKNYVSVRKNRILLQLRRLIDTTDSQYQDWELSRYAEPMAYAGLEDPDQIYNRFTTDMEECPETNVTLESAINPIMPGISLRSIALRILESDLLFAG